MSDIKTCPRCKELKPAGEFLKRPVRGRLCHRTYCRDCEKALTHRSYLKGNRWDNINRWEPVLTEAKVMQTVVQASEIRFYAHDIAHQLRVLHATGHTGGNQNY